MILTLVNVLYVLIAVAMIVLILLQRGAGAAAGSGFGGGASATVFGARGASNFLSKSTAILAALFFVLSLGMAMYATKLTRPDGADSDAGVMGAVPAALGLRVRLRGLRRRAHEVRRALLPRGHPVHRLRSRDRLPLPWAVVLSTDRRLRPRAMGIFLGDPVVGFIYEWKKGALEWE
jgi:protein translocase SecG subunit